MIKCKCGHESISNHLIQRDRNNLRSPPHTGVHRLHLLQKRFRVLLLEAKEPQGLPGPHARQQNELFSRIAESVNSNARESLFDGFGGHRPVFGRGSMDGISPSEIWSLCSGGEGLGRRGEMGKTQLECLFGLVSDDLDGIVEVGF